MLKSFYTTAILLLVAAVLSSLPVEAHEGAYRQNQEKALVKRIEARKKKERKLSHRVSTLAKKAARREHRGSKVHKHVSKEVRPAAPTDAASLAFWKQKGRLPWPVDQRKVTMHFGMQSYMPGVTINNLGISIAAEQDVPVKAVYEGVIDDVMDMGNEVAVVVLHGKYFTIYSDLAEAMVTKGQQVGAGDVLGRMGDAGQLEFRVYDDHGVWLDPEKWLVR